MQKVLLTFDGNHYSQAAFEFAHMLNEHEPILLIGVFLPSAEFTGAWSYAYSGSSVYIPIIENRDPALVSDTITKFETQCIQYGIDFRIHEDLNVYAQEGLKKESRYADLMILGFQKFYENMGLEKPNDYLKDALHDTECPVVIVPEENTPCESVVIVYDGSASSVYAIKSFATLFPHLCNMSTIVIYSESKPGEGIPDIKLIRELVSNHFSNVSFYEMNGDSKNQLNMWLDDITKPILVCGSYGRSGLSQFFHESFITDAIINHQTPIFIAHK